ncbi:MAG: permease [Candidatus Bipolaricaulota bacterium]|nr:permease [Candidatus Bipolaricaulota bacterium]
MLWELIRAGLIALQDYIALHVVTCLIPAFLLAGAMVTFVSKETIIYYLGATAQKLKAFALAAGGSFFVAACSCTVIPVSSGLYYAGAAIGAAFIILWVAPAANILALTYTGAILGGAMVLTRIVAALLMAFVVGWVMTVVFRREEQARVQPVAAPSNPGHATAPTRLMGRADVTLLVLLVISLLAPNYLVQKGPYWAKVLVWAIATVIVFSYAFWAKPKEELKRWMGETWWFVRLIFPLLLAGVFVVGVIGRLLPEEWVRTALGGSSLGASFLATLIGSSSRWRDGLLIVLSGLGMAIAGYLAYVETQAVATFCDPVGDCNIVQSSSYGKLFGVLFSIYLTYLEPFASGASAQRLS